MLEGNSITDVTEWVRWIHVAAAISDTRTDNRQDAIKQISNRIARLEQKIDQFAVEKRVRLLSTSGGDFITFAFNTFF